MLWSIASVLLAVRILHFASTRADEVLRRFPPIRYSIKCHIELPQSWISARIKQKFHCSHFVHELQVWRPVLVPNCVKVTGGIVLGQSVLCVIAVLT